MTFLVTGGAGGLGAATAAVLADRGARVVVADLRAPRTRLPDVHHVEHDVRLEESWHELRAEVRRSHGGLNCLVNNAGIGLRKGLLETDGEEFERVLRTNLWGSWYGIKTFAETLSDRELASVVNIASIYGVRPPPQDSTAPVSPAYQAAKAGLIMLTRTAAVELADRGITVNALSPGVFATPLVEDLTPDQLDLRVCAAAMKTKGRPEDVGSLVAYLASADARFVTGVNIPVDGGYLAS